MAFNFPDTPTVGQVFGNYTWDAATGAWKLTASGGSGGGGSITVSDNPPASPTAGALWWESDTGNLYIYYNDGTSTQWVAIGSGGGGGGSFLPLAGGTMSGPINAPIKGHLFGTPAGTIATGAVTPADANIILYGSGTNNWAGIGTDNGGNVWFRTGLTGTPAPAMYIDTSQVVHFTNPPVGNGAVRYDIAQSLTSEVPPSTAVSQRAQARMNIYASPFDALAYSGMQTNGAMEVNQEATSGTSVSNTYICDGWKFTKIGTSVPFAAAGSWAALASAPINGFTKALAVTVGTAQPSLSAGDLVFLEQLIEGYRVSRLAWGTVDAQPLTIGFWSKHSKVGVYTGSIRNSDAGNRSYAFTYTQNVSNASEYKTITIPGDTAAGPWATDNTAGLVLAFTVACGTTYTAPAANTWYGANYVAAPGQVNAVDSTANAFRITGVVVLPGIEAPSAARSPLIMRPYDQEIQICKRQLEISQLSVGTTGAGAFVNQASWEVEKRVTPSLTALSFNQGSGASFFAPGNSVYVFAQLAAHSLFATATIKGDARSTWQTYQLTASDSSVIRTEDGACIPNDPARTADWTNIRRACRWRCARSLCAARAGAAAGTDSRSRGGARKPAPR